MAAIGARHAGHVLHPPIAVRPEDRPTYIQSLQQAQAGEGTDAFDALLYSRLDATLDEYLSTLEIGR
jgi:hypothetical protein